MLIGQIEQEILEGRFWFYWLQTHPEQLDSNQRIDLQQDEAEIFWQLQKAEFKQSEAKQIKSEKRSRQAFDIEG